jgi:CheY-like chemotaxis protein
MECLNILVVEDESIIAMNTRMLLEYLGHVVIGIAKSGDMALDMLGRLAPPDLAMVDIKLKGAMDGIETAVLMRERFGVPFMFLTGNTDPRTMKEALGTSPYGILQKPFDEEDLANAIESAVSQMKKDTDPSS